MSTTVVGHHVDPEYIETAERRLVAYCQRHGIDLSHVYASDERRDAAGVVNNIMTEVYFLSEDGAIPKSRFTGALAVFRRAIGSRRADFLHVDSGRGGMRPAGPTSQTSTRDAAPGIAPGAGFV